MTVGSLSSEDIAQIASEQLKLPLLEGDADVVSKLLDDLTIQLNAMERLHVGERDPALTYDPSIS